MSNLPILYFTLGMLAGLPLGYRMGAVWYEQVLPSWLFTAEAFILVLTINDVTRQVGDIVADIKAAGIQPKETA